MKARKHRHAKDGALLLSVAESIGSALGTIAAKANAAQRVWTRSDAAHTVERKVKKLARKSKRVARKTTTAAVARLKRNKVAKAARRRLRRPVSSIKRAGRRG